MPTGSDVTTSIHNNVKIMTSTTTTPTTSPISESVTKTPFQDDDTEMTSETTDETTTTASNGAARNGNGNENCGTKLSTGTYDPTPYIQRARVTRPAPPKPSCNPMQFVQIKPCSLYQNAQEQLKRAEEIKKVKETKKEDPEDWQNNLDNWKSSRRKRVEHIIDRVVEVKKLELEEHDRTRRKSKTFSEMMEERGERKGRVNKLASLNVYTEDETNDLSDLGIGTSSASGKSSLSEDYDNHSVMSDNVETEKQNFGDIDNNSNNDSEATRDYISSPGYDTSSSTAPASSPDPCEYTYEGAIQDYKTRISRTAATTTATTSNYNNNGINSDFRTNISNTYSKDSTPERNTINDTSSVYQSRRGSKIEDRLMNFEVKSASSDLLNELSIAKKDLPKVDILKRRELFEKDKENSISKSVDHQQQIPINQKRFSGDFTNSKSVRERLTSLEKKPDDLKKLNRVSGDLISIKDRLQNLETKQKESESNKMITNSDGNTSGTASVKSQMTETLLGNNNNLNNSANTVPITLSIKDRMSSLQNAVTKEEIKKPVMLIDEHQLELLKKEDYDNKQALKALDIADSNNSQEQFILQDEFNIDTDREDSGIHTTDVSCSVSQTDEQPELVNDENHHGHHIINDDNICQTSGNTSMNKDFKTIESEIVKNTVEEIKKSEPVEAEIHESTEELSIRSNAVSSPEPQTDLESSVSLSESVSSSHTIIFDTNNHGGDGHTFLNEICSNSSNNVNTGGGKVDHILAKSNKIHLIENCSHNNNNDITITSNKFSPIKENFKNIDNDETNGRHIICIVNPKSLNSDTKKIQNINPSVVDTINPKNVSSCVVRDNDNDEKTVEVRSTTELISKFNIVESPKSPTHSDMPSDKKGIENIEEICEKVDVKNLPRRFSNTKTPCFDISLDDIKRCERNTLINDDEKIFQTKSNTENSLTSKCLQFEVPLQVLSTKNIVSSVASPLSSPLNSPPIFSISSMKAGDYQKLSRPPKYKNNSQTNSPLNSPLTSPKLSPLHSPKYISSNPYNRPNNLNFNSTPLPNNFQICCSNNTDGSGSHENYKNSGVLVAKLEMVETTIKVTSSNENSPLATPRTSTTPTPVESAAVNSKLINQSPESPNFNQKTHPNSKPKNIFDFLKKNFNNDNKSDENQIDSKISNSKFHTSKTNVGNSSKNDDGNSSSLCGNSSMYSNLSNNEVNIEITKIIKTEKIVEKTEKDLNMVDKINQFLNKEIKKFSSD